MPLRPQIQFPVTTKTTDRLLRFVEKTISCWNWIGCYGHDDGYGRFKVKDMNGRWTVIRPHRYMWSSIYGPIPAFHDVDHRCRNRKCVRPDHLEAVTRRENVRRADFTDKIAAIDARTHCSSGHPYAGNTYWYAGKRKCIPCRQARMREYHSRQRMAQ